MLFSLVKRLLLLWLHNPSDLLLYDRNIIGSSSEIFGYLGKSLVMFTKFSKKFSETFGNVRLAFGKRLKNLRKSSENRQKRRHWYVYIINRILHACWWIPILSSRVQLDISLVRADIELKTRR